MTTANEDTSEFGFFKSGLRALETSRGLICVTMMNKCILMTIGVIACVHLCASQTDVATYSSGSDTQSDIALNASSQLPVTLNIATIISFARNRLFSKDKIEPSIDYAIDEVRRRQLLPPWLRINVRYYDSQCNSKDAPVNAFHAYMQRNVDVFMGPVCDYSLAPVARYAPYWNLSVITPGGFAHDFGFNKSHPEAEYLTLTRVGWTFNSMALALTHTIQKHRWSKIKLLYDGEGHSEVSPRFCYLAGSALIYTIKEMTSLDHEFVLMMPDNDNERMLKEKVGTNTASKYQCYILITYTVQWT
ncbi:hypothetical protein DPMN_023116 [Dreissena polymorpha]|uniref:Receptor ligand binding region domain-containing protein n=1 Tax=Dreissena polymorpha TaxID=45954 RepID=A0A9D4LM95_DREPO|nr:hypothetical protein DPMN_023116 [Dreissena polymorpha]